MKGDSMKRLFRNSIGRLWWFAHVSFDRNRANPYELLPILLSNQNIQSALLERRIGMCRNLLIAVLELVNEFGGIKSTHRANARTNPEYRVTARDLT